VSYARRKPIREAVQKWFEEPVFFGFDFIPQLRECIENNKPFIFVDHAYFNRGYGNANFRVIRSDIHQRKAKAVDRPRFPVEMKPWKQGSKILVFPPSDTIKATYGAHSWTVDTVAGLADRPVIVKHKLDPKPLTEYLKDAYAVIGYGSVASVESVLAGVPAVAGPRCPCTSMGYHFNELPDREAWVNTLTWSQFHISEIESGLCREVINGLG
jgi:hypothetical protein